MGFGISGGDPPLASGKEKLDDIGLLHLPKHSSTATFPRKLSFLRKLPASWLWI